MGASEKRMTYEPPTTKAGVPIVKGQVWERRADGQRFTVMYTIVPEARIRYEATKRTPYTRLSNFDDKYRLVTDKLDDCDGYCHDNGSGRCQVCGGEIE